MKCLGFAEQIICDLVSSFIVMHTDNLLDEIWKVVNGVSYVSQQRESPWLFACEIFRNNILFFFVILFVCLFVCILLELWGVWYLDTSPWPSLGRVRRSFLLLWLWYVIIKYHERVLILTYFLSWWKLSKILDIFIFFFLLKDKQATACQ